MIPMISRTSWDCLIINTDKEYWHNSSKT